MTKIAEIAGVSAQTVSRVIYETGYVKASTREAVLQAIRDTGYRPNLSARALRTRRPSTIGLVCESELNPFFTKVAQSVQIEALQKGYTVLTLHHNGNLEAERMGVQQFIDQQVGAIIFCAARDPSVVRRAFDEGIPAIQLEREVAPVGNVILVDAVCGMRSAVSHLNRLGHSKIGYLGGSLRPWRSELPVTQSNEALRLNAFEACMKELGLEIENTHIGLGDYFTGEEGSPTDGMTLMNDLLRLERPPTAVIVGSDLIAAGALQAVHAAGLRVPQDISMIGYDNSLSNLLAPPLSTIAQPMRELGRLALSTAIDLIGGKEVLERVVWLPTALIQRNSTAPPRPVV